MAEVKAHQLNQDWLTCFNTSIKEHVPTGKKAKKISIDMADNLAKKILDDGFHTLIEGIKSQKESQSSFSSNVGQVAAYIDWFLKQYSNNAIIPGFVLDLTPEVKTCFEKLEKDLKGALEADVFFHSLNPAPKENAAQPEEKKDLSSQEKSIFKTFYPHLRESRQAKVLSVGLLITGIVATIFSWKLIALSALVLASIALFRSGFQLGHVTEKEIPAGQNFDLGLFQKKKEEEQINNSLIKANHILNEYAGQSDFSYSILSHRKLDKDGCLKIHEFSTIVDKLAQSIENIKKSLPPHHSALKDVVSNIIHHDDKHARVHIVKAID